MINFPTYNRHPMDCPWTQDHIDGLVQDCSNSIANAMELLQSCTKPSIYIFIRFASPIHLCNNWVACIIRSCLTTIQQNSTVILPSISSQQHLKHMYTFDRNQFGLHWLWAISAYYHRTWQATQWVTVFYSLSITSSMPMGHSKFVWTNCGLMGDPTWSLQSDWAIDP